MRYLLLFCLFVANASAQIEWTTHTINPHLESATTVRTFDAENDGDIDIISSSYNVSWYENDGSQNFVQHTITSNEIAATSLYVVDWEGDGDDDIVADAAIDNRLYWYENDGNGQFTPRLIYVNDSSSFESWATYSVHAADIDSDEDMDALHGGWEDRVIYWHENNGSDTSFTTLVIDTLGERSTVSAGDMDGDNDIDIVATCQNPSMVVWYENDGNQNFSRYTISDKNSQPRILNAIDLDKDGDLDVITAHYQGNVTWYENDGNKNFIPNSIEGSPTCNVIYVADMDNDNDLDIVTGDPDDDPNLNRIGWLENDGQQNFDYHIITANLNWSSSVWADDVDGDGDMDVLFTSLYDDKVAWCESNLVSSASNRKTAPLQFGLGQNYPNPFNPKTVINFSLQNAGRVELKIFNMLGQEVLTLVNSIQPPGTFEVVWNGRDSKGMTVVSGVYFYRLQAGEFVQTRKMLYLK